MKKYIISTIFMMALIFMFSSQSGSVSGGYSDLIVKYLMRFQLISKIFVINDNLAFLVRKSAHVFVYFMLGLNTYMLFYKYNQEKNKRFNKLIIVLMSIIFCLLYAISDEFHQSFVDGRGPSVKDVGIDSIGYIISNLILLKLKNSSHGHIIT